MKTPADVLTGLIVPLLVEDMLFLQDDAQKYQSKIATGTMKAEDWLLAIEKALDKEGGK